MPIQPGVHKILPGVCKAYGICRCKGCTTRPGQALQSASLGRTPPHLLATLTARASALASLAMFKLFNDWQSQGYQLPSELMKPGSIFSEKQVPPPPQGHPALTGTWSHDTPPGNLSQTPASEKKQKPKKEKVKKEKGEEGEKGLPENHMEKHPVQV